MLCKECPSRKLAGCRCKVCGTPTGDTGGCTTLFVFFDEGCQEDGGTPHCQEHLPQTPRKGDPLEP